MHLFLASGENHELFPSFPRLLPIRVLLSLHNTVTFLIGFYCEWWSLENTFPPFLKPCAPYAQSPVQSVDTDTTHSFMVLICGVSNTSAIVCSRRKCEESEGEEDRSFLMSYEPFLIIYELTRFTLSPLVVVQLIVDNWHKCWLLVTHTTSHQIHTSKTLLRWLTDLKHDKVDNHRIKQIAKCLCYITKYFHHEQINRCIVWFRCSFVLLFQGLRKRWEYWSMQLHFQQIFRSKLFF